MSDVPHAAQTIADFIERLSSTRDGFTEVWLDSEDSRVVFNLGSNAGVTDIGDIEPDKVYVADGELCVSYDVDLSDMGGGA